MDIDNSVLEKINTRRDKKEAAFVFSLWKDPELYANYLAINEGKDETLQDKDAIFYFNLGKAMYLKGYKTFDAISIDTFLENKPNIKEKYEQYGGFHEIDQLERLISPDNIDTYFDEIIKLNTLSMIYKKYHEVYSDVERFNEATSEDIYNTFELLNNSVSLTAGLNESIENLTIDNSFIEKLKAGENVGFNYSKYAPMLNYITLGCAPGSLYMLAGHSGNGKSSFVFGNMLMGLHHAGVGVAVISNEMDIETYKLLLLEHVLVNELNYYGLTRKQVKIGKYTEEQEEKIHEAQKIINDKYNDIVFVQLFDNRIPKILKYLRRLKAKGIQVVLYDTFKSDDAVETGQIWQSLMLDARKIFQCCSKLGMCCITTYQLALHTTNQRFLDASCLSNSKQIKEIYETMVYTRPLWDDEYPGEKNDVHPYRLNSENNKIKESIELDRDKKYLLFFIDKTRADEDKKVLLYEWNPRFNKWKELGFARVINDHGQSKESKKG